MTDLTVVKALLLLLKLPTIYLPLPDPEHFRGKKVEKIISSIDHIDTTEYLLKKLNTEIKLK